jgi:hypothetical protein
MNCSCINYGSEDLSQPEFFREKMVKAKKQHKCGECGATIEPGEKYENAVGVWDGEFSTHKTCSICCEVRNELFCGSYGFGEVWQEIREWDSVELGGLDRFSKEAQIKICEML